MRAPLVLLVGAVVIASAVVALVTPAALVKPPERPFAGEGNADVRIGTLDYPRTAVGADDERVSVAAPPRRVISQHWSTDEFLYTVLQPERIVGVSEAAYDPNLSNVTESVDRYRPVVALNPEVVIRARPDLVFSPSPVRAEVPGLLRQSGVPVYRIYTMYKTLASIEEHIRLVGYLTGEDARADAEARRFHAIVERSAARRPSGMAPPRVMGFNGTYSYGSKTLFHDIIRVLGAENLAATHGLIGYDQVTDEHIIRWDPDWIVAGAAPGQIEERRAQLLAHPAFSTTRAAKLGQILVFEYHVFLPLSPFTTALVEALAGAFYGDPS